MADYLSGRRRDGTPVPNMELKTSVSLPIRLMDGGCSVNTFRQSDTDAFGSDTGILLRWQPVILVVSTFPLVPGARREPSTERSSGRGGAVILNQTKSGFPFASLKVNEKFLPSLTGELVNQSVSPRLLRTDKKPCFTTR